MADQNRLGRRLQIRKIKPVFYFSSLFSKLVFIYLGILVFILTVIFITFTHSFQTFFVDYTKGIMLSQAKNIAKEYEAATRYSASKEEALSYIRRRIEILNEYLQATTWVVDEGGIGYQFALDKQMTLLENPIIAYDLVGRIYQGQVIEYENGFKGYFDTPVLTIGYPLEVDQKVQYALFIHTPMPYVLKTIETIRIIILKTVCVVGSFVFVWIYFISKQMVRPLKSMNSAAKVIAGGSFNERIQVCGEDEIAQLGRSLNHMAEALDDIENKRRSFIASISHDLRSPLTSISGYVTAILDGTIEPKNQEKYLHIVLSETKRLITMTNAILDMNRLEENVQIERIPFNVIQLIECVTFNFKKRFEEKRLHVFFDLDEAHAWVLGQPDSINRVIQNILENAYKFVHPGGDILLRTRVRDGKLWVSILNSGPPIPKEQQQLIWERFYKGDSSRGKDKNGVGLGLVIVKELIKQHHEEVGVISNPDDLVEFYFSLTLASPPAQDDIKKLAMHHKE